VSPVLAEAQDRMMSGKVRFHVVLTMDSQMEWWVSGIRATRLKVGNTKTNHCGCGDGTRLSSLILSRHQ